MATILSLQSHVSYGYVGNRAAVFPLQRMGHEVIVINTVQFSNHPGYSSYSGDIMTLEHIDQVFNGLAQLGVLNQLDAVLTGYIGDKALGEILLKWLAVIRHNNPQLIYCCDPVIGDTAENVFVRSGIPEFFKEQALKQATILTPNQFELTHLTGIKIVTLDDVKRACHQLHQAGVKYVVVTSLLREETKPKTIELLVSDGTKSLLVATPRLRMEKMPHGAGDMMAAIFLAKFIETKDLSRSIAHTAAAVFAVFAKTQQLGTQELAIIQAQDSLLVPPEYFPVTEV